MAGAQGRRNGEETADRPQMTSFVLGENVLPLRLG